MKYQKARLQKIPEIKINYQLLGTKKFRNATRPLLDLHNMSLKPR